MPRCQQRDIQRILKGTIIPRSKVISTRRKTSSTCKDIVFVAASTSLKPGGILSLSGHSNTPGTTCARYLWVIQGTRMLHTWQSVQMQSAMPFHLWAWMLLLVMLLQSKTLLSHDEARYCSRMRSLNKTWCESNHVKGINY